MPIIVTENVFPKGIRLADLEAEVADRLLDGALSCRIEVHEGGIFSIITVYPSLKMIQAARAAEPANPDPSNAAATRWAKAALHDAAPDGELGRLSRKYESNGKPDAIGTDSIGGPSYGLYQIATRTGTMSSFLRFLERVRPDFARQVSAAGGETGASQKAPNFVAAWRALAADPAFSVVQHAFIKSTHYDPFIIRLKSQLGLDIVNYPPVIADVVWSTAVQHGPGNKVFERALRQVRRKDLSAEVIIDRVYSERSNVDIYFSRSNLKVKHSLLNRFSKERADALNMLA